MKISFFSNKIVRNAGWLMSGKIIQMAISLIVGIITARYLGPSDYGLINYAAAYAAFFTSFCTLGINSILVKEFIDHPEAEGVTIGTTLILRSVSSFLSACTVILISCVADAGEPVTIAVVALYSVGIIFGVFDTFNYWFQAHLKSKVTAIVTLVAYIVTSIYRIVLLILGKNVIFFAFATSVDHICLAILLLVTYKKHGGKPLKFSASTAKRLLKSSAPFILSGMMVAIYGYTDKFMLKHLLDESQVGYYATATAVCTMYSFVIKAIIDSMYPSVMEANNTDSELFKKRNRQLYAIVFYVSIGISLFITIFSGVIVSILYGDAFLPATKPLSIITWYTAFSFLGVARDAWIVCKQKQKYLFPLYLLAAITNVILNLFFIPKWQASGAALASLITQILTCIIIPLFMTPLRENTWLMLEAICLKNIKKEK